MVNTNGQLIEVGGRFWTLTLLALPAASLGLMVLMALTGSGFAGWSWLTVPAVLGGFAVQGLPGIRSRSGAHRVLWTLLAAVLTTLVTAFAGAAVFFGWLLIACGGGGCFS